jgi:hypothetical protein
MHAAELLRGSKVMHLLPIKKYENKPFSIMHSPEPPEEQRNLSIL